MAERILLVDDDPVLRDVHAELLRSSFDVVVAGDAEEALVTLMEDGPFAVVLSDHDLPGATGVELLAKARDRCPETTRLLLTGEAEFDLAVRAVNEAHVLRYLQKPIGPDELRDAVDEAVRERLRRVAKDAFASAVQDATGVLQSLDEQLGAALGSLCRLSSTLATTDEPAAIARIAADVAFEMLPGRGIRVQVWDDEHPAGAIDADAGPEMSADMHREPLLTPDMQVGEIVIDARGENGECLGTAGRDALGAIAAPVAIAVRSAIRRRELARAQHATVLAMANLAEQRDDETGFHLDRVSEFSRLVAEGLVEDGRYTDEITDEFVVDLVRAAPLHDIGKVGIPDSVLLKPGKLNESEWELMKTHAELGARALERVIGAQDAAGFLAMGRDVAWCHHERWDGTGYPRGLAADEIPLAARIVAVADIYDALTSARPYKAAWPHERAIETIRELGGNHLDPHVANAFLARAEEAKRIRAALAGDAEDAPSEAPEHALGMR